MIEQKLIRALRLIDGNARLAAAGLVLVSQAAAELLAAGLIVHAPERRTAYALTTAGREAVAR